MGRVLMRLHVLIAITVLTAMGSSGDLLTNISDIERRFSPGYDELYSDGIRAYNNGMWTEAVDLLERAIADYKDERLVSSQCSIKCQDEVKAEKLIEGIDGELTFLRYSLKMQTCKDACTRKFLGVRGPVSEHINNLFEDRTPYNYLQFAYHQIKKTQKAADAAMTYFELHKNDQLIQDNLNIYSQQLAVNQSHFVSREQSDHVTAYKRAISLYSRGDFKSSISIFEEALTGWFKAYGICVARCENVHERTQYTMRVALFTHYVNLLKCRSRCRNETNMYDGTIISTIMPYHYHYLQFCYFKLQQYEEAMMAAQSFILFDPTDDIMQQNIKFYEGKLRGELKGPRERALRHYNQVALEDELFEMAKMYSNPVDTLHDTEHVAKTGTSDQVRSSQHDKTLRNRRGARGEDGDSQDFMTNENWMQYRDKNRWRNNPNFQRVVLAMDEKQLNGSERVMFDGVASAEECRTLMKLVKKTATSGDGYSQHKDSKHPFTEKETFEGITVDKVVQKVGTGEASKEEAELYLSMSERVRLLLEEYFDMPIKLQFAYTHLVCRHAVHGASSGEHISHPIHSDNCILNGDGPGTCPKRAPAYTERDFSSVLYLNDDFDGGDFMFADHDGTIQKRVKPKCGRLVGFSSKGIYNLHGVLGISRGTRCSLPMWTTLQPNKAEAGQFVARKTLALLEKNKERDDEHKKRMNGQKQSAKQEANEMNVDPGLKKKKVDLETNDQETSIPDLKMKSPDTRSDL